MRSEKGKSGRDRADLHRYRTAGRPWRPPSTPSPSWATGKPRWPASPRRPAPARACSPSLRRQGRAGPGAGRRAVREGPGLPRPARGRADRCGHAQGLHRVQPVLRARELDHVLAVVEIALSARGGDGSPLYDFSIRDAGVAALRQPLADFQVRRVPGRLLPGHRGDGDPRRAGRGPGPARPRSRPPHRPLGRELWTCSRTPSVPGETIPGPHHP